MTRLEDMTPAEKAEATQVYMKKKGLAEEPTWDEVQCWLDKLRIQKLRKSARTYGEFLAMKDLKRIHRSDWLTLVHKYRDMYLEQWSILR